MILNLLPGIFILRCKNGDYGIKTFTGVSGYRRLLRLTLIGFCGEAASNRGSGRAPRRTPRMLDPAWRFVDTYDVAESRQRMSSLF